MPSLTAAGRLLLAAWLGIALVAAGCGSRSAGKQEAAAEQIELLASEAPSPGAPPAAMLAQDAVGTRGSSANAAVAAAGASTAVSVPRRMLVRNVSLSLVVADVDSSARRLEAFIAARGGFIASSSAEERGGFPFRSYTLRVPADRLDSVLVELRALAVRITNESQSVQDVTDQAVDVQARLRTLLATETELIGLMKDARARNQKAEDVMAIYRELTGIRTQIEQYQGQLQSLQDLAALSTVSLTLSPDAAAGPIQAHGWRPGETFANSLRQLTSAIRALGDFSIWAVVVLLPLGLTAGLVLAMLLALIRLIRGRIRGSRQG